MVWYVWCECVWFVALQEVVAAVVSEGVFPLCISAFFEFEWNNLLHNDVK